MQRLPVTQIGSYGGVQGASIDHPSSVLVTWPGYGGREQHRAGFCRAVGAVYGERQRGARLRRRRAVDDEEVLTAAAIPVDGACE
ncbi:MAG: hypothetical protein ACOC1F_13325 [Myxococcota bacterium]